MKTTKSNRHFKLFIVENDLMQKLNADTLKFYLDIKKDGYYKDFEEHRRGTLNTTHRQLAKKYLYSVSKVQDMLHTLESLGLIELTPIFYRKKNNIKNLTNCKKDIYKEERPLVVHSTTSNTTSGRSKITGTTITFCFYDNCKNEQSNEQLNKNIPRIAQKTIKKRDRKNVTNCKKDIYKNEQRVTEVQKREVEVSPYIYINKDIDRKDIIKEREIFSNENILSKEINFEGMEPTNENFEISQDFKKFKNEVLEILENLKNENFELKKEISILKNKIFESQAKNEIESSLNTEKNEKERKSCGKKKNTAVLSHENLKEDKLHQTGGENATGGLKMANTGISQKFVPPTLQEVEEYCKERRNGVDAEMFVDFYASKGWLVGKTKMKDWKACIRTWERSRNYSKDRASVKNRDDWNGNNELRFKENLKLVTNSKQWRDYSNQTYVDFNRDDKIAYYNEFIIKFANNTKYSEIFYDDELQTKLKEHFLNFLNVKLAKKQEFKERQKSYLNKPQEKTFMQRTAERMEQAGMFRIFDEIEEESKRLC